MNKRYKSSHSRTGVIKKHRNSQKRIYFEDAVYFVTTNTGNWVPFFKEKIFCDLFVENLKLCKKLKEFRLYAWFLGYNHFHLLLRPGDDFDYSKIMQFLKRHVTRDINWIFNPPEGAIRESRLRVGNYEKCEKLIVAHDKKLIELKNQFIQKYGNQNPFPKFKWHKSFNDHYIRNENDFNYHWGYTKWNPIKHKLPENWPYVFTNPKYEDLIDDYL